MRCKIVLLLMLFQFAWIGTVNGSAAYSIKYAINYDPDFYNVASYWRYSSWNNHSNPADYWMKAENGIITLYYKANRTDWGNTEVYQGKKPAFEVEKPLWFRDFRYKECSGGLNLSAKVRRDIDPVWQGPSLSNKSPYPQANIGVYLWLEVQGWNYDDWNKTSSLIIDIYFDSRNETRISNAGDSYFQNATPYDPQIHAGYVIGTLPLNAWQEFDVDVAALIDRALQKCRAEGITLPSNEVAIKFFGVYVDSFSAAVQASFDYALLKDTTNEELQAKIENLEEQLNSTKVEIQNMKNEIQSLKENVTSLSSKLDSALVELETIRNLYVFLTVTIILMATILVYFVKRKLPRISNEKRTTR